MLDSCCVAFDLKFGVHYIFEFEINYLIEKKEKKRASLGHGPNSDRPGARPSPELHRIHSHTLCFIVSIERGVLCWEEGNRVPLPMLLECVTSESPDRERECSPDRVVGV